MEVTPKRGSTINNDGGYTKNTTDDGVLLPGWLMIYIVASDVVVIVTIGDPGGLYS
jgi:hypothetical protein